jgi:hypothetical protein
MPAMMRSCDKGNQREAAETYARAYDDRERSHAPHSRVAELDEMW